MNRPCLELPEAAGKVIKVMRVYDDPPYGREVHLIFTDGTELSVDIGVKTCVDAKHYNSSGGGMDVLHRHVDPPGSEEPLLEA